MKIGIITLTLSTALLFSTAGFADNNTVELDQSGNDNLITVTQVGGSSVEITQNGDHNMVAIDQWGGDARIVQQDSSQAVATIFQEDATIGSEDYIQLLQINSTDVTANINFSNDYSQLGLRQEGSHLQFEAVDSETALTVLAMDGGRGQFGTGNSAVLMTNPRYCCFSDNIVYFHQEGESNHVETTQNFFSNTIILDQSGELNTMLVQADDGMSVTTLNQSGTFNLIDLQNDWSFSLTINQSGTENSITGTLSSSGFDYSITQSGNLNLMSLDIHNDTDSVGGVDTTILTQTGDSGIMSLTQNGRGLSAALTQSGIGNTMTIDQSGTNNHVEVTQN